MGIFDRMSARFGGVDERLLANGRLARGNVRSCEPTAMSTGRSGAGLGLRIVCRVSVEVVGLDGEDPYDASCLHPIPQVYLPRMSEPGAAVAVRVDPDDPQRIVLDLEHEVPAAPIVLVSDDGTKQTVETHVGTSTTKELLRDGRPCTLDVLAVFPLGQLTQAGLPASGLILQVEREGSAPYQAQIGMHVPDAAAAVVVPGAKLPGKWLPGPGLPTDVNLVTIDLPALGIDPKG